MSSGSQAQIAAAQASSSAQAEAAANALAFAREQFGEAKANRAPYLQAGASATGALMGLLGLAPTLSKGGGGVPLVKGGGITLGNLGKGGGISGGGLKKSFEGITLVPDELSKDEGTITRTPSPPPLTKQPGDLTFGRPTDPHLLTSGGTPTATSSPQTAIRVIGPDGTARWIPSSLASFYQARGFSLEG